MRHSSLLATLAALGFLSLGAAPSLAQTGIAAFPTTFPPNTVYGRLGAGASGPGQAIPFTLFIPNLLTALGGTNGQVLVGVTGAPPLMATLSQDCTITAAGVITCTKTNNVAFAPSATTDTTNAGNISSGILPAARLPVPTASTLGGVESLAAVTHNFLTAISTAGLPTQAQPACGDLSNATGYCSAAVGQLAGTATNDAASAGNIGEFVSSVLAKGSAVSLTTSTPKTVTSISLTAGDWDVWGSCTFTGSSSTQYTFMECGTNTTTNAEPGAGANRTDTGPDFASSTPFIGSDRDTHVLPARFSLSTTTTVFIVANMGFTVSSASAYGYIEARRRR